MGYAEDGITTYEGADEPLVTLWDGGVVRTGTIRDLCRVIRDVVDGESPVAAYMREGDELVSAAFDAVGGGREVLVTVHAKSGAVANARYRP